VDPTDVFKNNLGHWIKKLDHVMTIKINELLRPYGLARSQWEVLYRIQNSKGISQKDLQDVMKVESGTLTGIVDALVRKGWVTRREHPNDRRVKVLIPNADSPIKWTDVPNPIHVLRPVMMQRISSEDESFVIGILKTAVLNLENSENVEAD
jgi:DNA-binding MarR family transcriptional regulator